MYNRLQSWAIPCWTAGSKPTKEAARSILGARRRRSRRLRLRHRRVDDESGAGGHCVGRSLPLPLLVRLR